MQLGQLTANEPHDTPPGGAPSACGHGPPMGFRDQQEVLRGRASYAPECAPSTMTISTALSRPCRALDVVREGSAAAAGFNAGSGSALARLASRKDARVLWRRPFTHYPSPSERRPVQAAQPRWVVTRVWAPARPADGCAVGLGISACLAHTQDCRQRREEAPTSSKASQSTLPGLDLIQAAPHYTGIIHFVSCLSVGTYASPSRSHSQGKP